MLLNKYEEKKAEEESKAVKELVPHRTTGMNTTFFSSADCSSSMHFTTIKAMQSFDQAFKFRLKAQVVDHFPADLKDCSKPYCHHCQCFVSDANVCERCDAPGGTVRWEYMLKLVLKDGSGSMAALLSLHDARHFFLGLPPTDLATNNISFMAFKKRVHHLLTDGTWLDLCVMSYSCDRDDDDFSQISRETASILDITFNESRALSSIDGKPDANPNKVFKIFGTSMSPCPQGTAR